MIYVRSRDSALATYFWFYVLYYVSIRKLGLARLDWRWIFVDFYLHQLYVTLEMRLVEWSGFCSEGV